MIRTNFILLLALFGLTIGAANGSTTASADISLMTGQAAYSKGASLYDDGEYEKAGTYLWQAIKTKKPGDAFDITQALEFFLLCYGHRDKEAEGFAFLATEYAADNNIPHALNYARMALKEDPENEDALEIVTLFGDFTPGQTAYDKGNEFFASEQYEEAADQFWIAISKRESHDSYELQHAYTNFVKCYEMQNDTHGASLRISREYLKVGDMKSAYLYAKRIQEMDPENDEVLEIMDIISDYDFDLNELEEQTRPFQKQSQAQNQGQAAYEKGMVLFDMGEYQQASNMFWTALVTKQPVDSYDISDAFNKFFNCYIEMDNVVGAHLFMAAQYAARGQGKEAVLQAIRAIQLEPENKKAMEIFDLFPEEYKKASENQAFQGTGQNFYDAAEKLFLQEDYENAAAGYWRAIELRTKQDTFDANEAIQKILECYAHIDEPAAGFAFLATQYAGVNRMEHAVEYAKKALQEDPENEEALEIIEMWNDANAKES